MNGKCGKYGKKVFPDGRTYYGEMSCDVPHGRGKMIKSNGNARYGKWEKGIFQKSQNDPSNQRGLPLNEIQESNANEEGQLEENSKGNAIQEGISICI